MTVGVWVCGVTLTLALSHRGRGDDGMDWRRALFFSGFRPARASPAVCLRSFGLRGVTLTLALSHRGRGDVVVDAMKARGGIWSGLCA